MGGCHSLVPQYAHRHDVSRMSMSAPGSGGGTGKGHHLYEDVDGEHFYAFTSSFSAPASPSTLSHARPRDHPPLRLQLTAAMQPAHGAYGGHVSQQSDTGRWAHTRDVTRTKSVEKRTNGGLLHPLMTVAPTGSEYYRALEQVYSCTRLFLCRQRKQPYFGSHNFTNNR